MAETSYPFDNEDTTETQYSQLFQRLRSTGVWGSPNDTELKAYGDSSGMSIKLPAGFALVRGHVYLNDATQTITIPTADATARIDTLVLRLDPGANTITPEVLTGTPGAGVGPTPTQTDAAIYELPLANIAVGANATTITSGNVTDRRTFSGNDFGLWTTNTRPTSPRMGQPGFNSTTLKMEYWTGTAWSEFTPTSLPASVISDPGNLSVGYAANAGLIGGKKITVSQTQPSSPSTGDVWISW